MVRVPGFRSRTNMTSKTIIDMCQDDDETDLKAIKEDNIDQEQVAGSSVHGYERSSSIKFREF
jgi:hypothetical protein